jgi:UDP-glucose 4-epimerase
MRVLVTGGAGFIGSNLCRELAGDADSVTVLDDLSTGDAANLDGVEVDLRVGSVLDSDLVTELVSRADAVVHLAARGSVPRSLVDPLRTHLVNATGTLHVLEAVRRHGAHLVWSSSSSVYGPNAVIPQVETAPPAPASPYAASKLAAEAYADSFAACFGIDLLTFRFFNVYGPYQSSGHSYAAVIPTFIERVLTGQPITIHGDGEQRRDFTHVSVVTSVLREALRRRTTADGPVNLALGGGQSVSEIAAEVMTAIGTEVEVVHTAPRLGDIRHSRSDPSRLLALFPGTAAVPLRAGLSDTVRWYSDILAAER